MTQKPQTTNNTPIEDQPAIAPGSKYKHQSIDRCPYRLFVAVCGGELDRHIVLRDERCISNWFDDNAITFRPYEAQMSHETSIQSKDITFEYNIDPVVGPESPIRLDY